MRRGLAWFSAVPLIFAGSQVAHLLAYRWVYPDSHVRLDALLSTGHSYMDQMPLVLGIAGAVVFISLLSAIAQAARGLPLLGVPPLAFALLPMAAFTLQEILERSLHTGTFVWQAVESPTFLPGLVLQFPFAAVAFFAARLLLRVAEQVGRTFLGRPLLRRQPLQQLSPPRFDPLVRTRPLACQLAKRGPPPLLPA